MLRKCLENSVLLANQGIPLQVNQRTFSGLFAGDGSFSFPAKSPHLPPKEMSEKIKIEAVPNCRPLYLAEPCEEGEGVTCRLSPILAWKVCYEESEDERGDYCYPLGIEINGSDWAIYDKDADLWFLPYEASGKGLDSLKEHFERVRGE